MTKTIISAVMLLMGVSAFAQDNPCPNPTIFGTTYSVAYLAEVNMCMTTAPLLSADGCLATHGEIFSPEVAASGYRVMFHTEVADIVGAYNAEDLFAPNFHEYFNGIYWEYYGTGVTALNLDYGHGVSPVEVEEDVYGPGSCEDLAWSPTWAYLRYVKPHNGEYRVASYSIKIDEDGINYGNSYTSSNYVNQFGDFYSNARGDWRLVFVPGEDVNTPENETLYDVVCITTDTVTVTEVVTDTVIVEVIDTSLVDSLQAELDAANELVIYWQNQAEYWETSYNEIILEALAAYDAGIADGVSYAQDELFPPLLAAEWELGYSAGYQAGLDDCEGEVSGLVDIDGTTIEVIGYYNQLGQVIDPSRTTGVIIRKHSDGTFSKYFK